jgi:hypothetical protein
MTWPPVCARCEAGRMLSHEQAARTQNTSAESIRRLHTSGEIRSYARDADLVDSLSLETFRSSEREQVGRILQELEPSGKVKATLAR